MIRCCVAGCAALGLLLGAASLHAQEVRCVDTVAELDAAVRIAEDDDVEIHLVRGSYDITGTVLECFAGSICVDDADPDDNIDIIGGYAPGCGSRQLDPFATELTADDASIYIYGADDSGDLRLESLTLRGVRSLIRLGGAFSDGYRMTLSRVALVDAPMVIDASNVTVGNSIIVDSAEAFGLYVGCALALATEGLDTVSVSHSVFTDNPQRGLCLMDGDTHGGWSLTVANSLFWNNGGVDLYLRGEGDDSDASLVANILQDSSIVPAPAQPPSGSLNADPQFVNPADENFRLQSDSPAVNSGALLASSQTGQDADGGPRWIGSRPDRGAYETNIDDTNIITVTNTSDQIAPLVTGSLRWAIVQANNDGGLNTIRFNIPGGCPRIIDLNAPLPDITDRVIIEGYSQPGSAANTSSWGFNADLCIGISGDLSDDHALRIPDTVPESHYLQVSGIGFGGFDVAAVRIAGGAGSWIHGNQFGGELGGIALGNSAVNVRIGGASYHNLIGGDEPAQRNLIAFAWEAGVQLLDNSAGADGYDNYVTNNLIGTNAGGSAAAPNQLGLLVRTRGNRIEDNVISGNMTHGIFLEGGLADDNYVVGNRIGLKAFAICAPLPCTPDYALGNIDMGVLVQGGGSDNYFGSNTVAFNGQKGIRLFDGQRNKLLHNRVYENESLGIDIGVAGVNPSYNANDPGSAGLANRGINAPAIAFARGGEHEGRVTGIFLSSNGNYIVQVFTDTACDGSGRGEGRTPLTVALAMISNAAPGSNGSVVFDIPFDTTLSLQPRYITAVVTDPQGNSSEFSDCQAYDCDQIFAHGFVGAADRCSEP